MNISDLSRNHYMLKGDLAFLGYDWWWHSFTGYHHETGEAKGFFIEYYVCNPALSENEVRLGQLKENREKGLRPSYCMIKAGAWGKDAKQIHNFYPISAFSCPEDYLQVKIAGNSLGETYMKGSCSVTQEEVDSHPEYMCDAGTMSWNLAIDKKISYHVGYGASQIFRKLNIFEMFWHAEGIKTEYGGTVIYNNEVYDIIPSKSYGYADKNWGSDFTSPWLWLSSCNMTSTISGKKLNNSAFELGGGRPKIFGIPLNRKLLGGLFYEGKMYEYNFSKFWTMTHIGFSFTEGEKINTWKVKASNRDSMIKLIVTCPKEEMLFINYEAPNGKKLHNRLWNGGTGTGKLKLYHKDGQEYKLIDIVEFANTGCEYGENE